MASSNPSISSRSFQFGINTILINLGETAIIYPGILIRRTVDGIGRYLGTLEAPHLVEQQPQPVFRSGSIYYVTKDELDVQYVVVAEIRGRE